MKQGDKIKMVNVIGQPEGIITNAYTLYPEAGSLNPHYLERAYWIRLTNGMLLKDVLVDEMEVLK